MDESCWGGKKSVWVEGEGFHPHSRAYFSSRCPKTICILNANQKWVHGNQWQVLIPKLSSRMSFDSVALNSRRVAQGFGAGDQVVLIRQVRRAKEGKRLCFWGKSGTQKRLEDESCVHHSEPIRFSSCITEPVSQTRTPAMKRFWQEATKVLVSRRKTEELGVQQLKLRPAPRRKYNQRDLLKVPQLHHLTTGYLCSCLIII